MKDYGCNPLGNGKFQMIPSGDIVDAAEKETRLAPLRNKTERPIFGMSWNELEKKQGGKLKR